MLKNAEAFGELVNRMVKKLEDFEFDKVVCIEGRGFLLGSAVAYKLGKGIIPARIPGKLKREVFSEKYVDYTGSDKTLEIHQDALESGEKVVIIDDWLQTGESVEATLRLVEKTGGVVIGILVFMDDSTKDAKEYLLKYGYQYLESDF